MSIANVNSTMMAAYQYASKMQRNHTAKTAATGFLSVVSAQQAGKTEGTNLKDMLKAKYPNAYYNVMDTSKIDGGAWGRQDYPWDAYFKEPADESVLSWKLSGPEPDMQSPEVHAKLNSMLGKVAVVIPPELEEKMKNDPKLAQSVMDKIDNFILENELSAPGVLKGYVMTFDENGKMNHACVAGEGRITVSSSEFVEARKEREAKQAQYERLAKEAAMKRRLRQREVEKNSVEEMNASDADERLLGIGFLKGSGNMHYGMRAEYAEDYSEDNPIITVRVQKGNGKADEYNIDVRKVNPQTASEIEMFALCSYADANGTGTGETFGSWQTLNYYRNNAAHNGYFEMTNTMDYFRNVKQDWISMISAMIDDYMDSGLFRQAMDGRMLLGMFGSFIHDQHDPK